MINKFIVPSNSLLGNDDDFTALITKLNLINKEYNKKIKFLKILSYLLSTFSDSQCSIAIKKRIFFVWPVTSNEYFCKTFISEMIEIIITMRSKSGSCMDINAISDTVRWH